MRVVLKEDFIPELVFAKQKVWERIVVRGGRDPLWAECRVGNYLGNIKTGSVDEVVDWLTEYEVPLVVRKDTRPGWVQQEDGEDVCWLWLEPEDCEGIPIGHCLSKVRNNSLQLSMFGAVNLGKIPKRFIAGYNEIGVRKQYDDEWMKNYEELRSVKDTSLSQ